ncbi:MAG: SGNH/GDSL hydrolase family protein [Candidatus Melainabacteria bacterium]
MPNTRKPPAWISKIGDTLLLITSNVGTVVLLLVVGHFLLAGLWELKQQTVGIKRYDPRLLYEMYDGFPDKMAFAREYIEARKMSLQPHVMWLTNPYKGKYIQIDENGIRRTIKHPRPDARKVFVLGGSTLWGEGSPDKDTIPSQLQARLGDGYDVTNMGQTAWTSVQELNYLLGRLSAGDIPDIVIFYDGVNDGFTTLYSPAKPRSIHNIEKVLGFHTAPTSWGTILTDVYNQSGYKVLEKVLKTNSTGGESNTSQWDEKVAPKIDENVTTTLDEYDQLIRQVQALSKVYGFKTYFFWQPYLFSDHREPVGDEKIPYGEASATWIDAEKKLYTAARQRFSRREKEQVYFIGDVLDEAGPVYIDWCHISPKANGLVADAMFSRIVRTLGSPPSAAK